MLPQSELLETRATLGSAHLFFGQIVALAKNMGFESCSYKIQMPVPISRPTVLTFNSADVEMSQTYRRTSGYIDDAKLIPLIKDMAQFDWLKKEYALPSSAGEQNQDQHAHREWTHVSRDGASGAVGELTLTRKFHQPGQSYLTAAWLTSFAHVGMSKLLVPEYVPESLVVFTPREKEVLRWTAEGKTAYEIGQILVISENTVLFHLKNVVNKLGASNKMQAAVKATALGMLW